MSTKWAKQILKKIDNLPPLPGVVSKVLALAADTDFDMKRLIQTVYMDPAITAKVIMTCNSSFFGLRHKVSSLEQAAPYLGVNNLVDVILNVGIGPIFKEGQEGYQLARGQLWRHSMASALAAKRLADLFHFPEPSVLHTAALLHDVGKLILSEFVAGEFRTIERLVIQDGWPLARAEKKVLRMDHAELGGIAAKKWRLTDEIKNAIAYHHEPAKSDAPRALVNLTALANHLAIQAGHGGGFGDEHFLLPPTVLFELNIYPQQASKLAKEMKTYLDGAAGLLSLAG